jgi:[protein-PII] uridylyltransferase
VGLRIAEETARRFSLSPEQAETLKFLVHRHLLMSHVGLKYDTSQTELINRFARDVCTQSRLDMLYVVSCADLAAVGPDVLTNWKVEVLSELYLQASRQLAAVGGAVVDGACDGERHAARRLLSPAEQGDPWFDRQLAALPESFVGKHPAAAVVDTLRRLRNLAPRSGVAWARYVPDTDTVEFMAGIDQGSGRAIFSSMAGALTANRMQILAADTFTLADGLLLLRYVASEPESPGEPTEARLDSLCEALVASIDSEAPPRFPKILGREQKEAAATLTNLPNKVRIDTELSGECTVVEVVTVDRRGLLYRLARALHDLGLVIRFSKIGTYLDQVVDVFYVTERDGQKPRSDERLEEIRRTLMEAIVPGEDQKPAS